MSQDDLPNPESGLVLTHFLVVSDQDRSREFYQSVFGATAVRERDPVIMKLANSWLILNVGGGPTDDKPAVTLTTPADPDRTSGADKPASTPKPGGLAGTGTAVQPAGTPKPPGKPATADGPEAADSGRSAAATGDEASAGRPPVPSRRRSRSRRRGR